MGRARDRHLCAAALESQLGAIPQLLSWESSLESIPFKLVLFVSADRGSMFKLARLKRHVGALTVGPLWRD
jgi:hypothetical protein